MSQFDFSINRPFELIAPKGMISLHQVNIHNKISNNFCKESCYSQSKKMAVKRTVYNVVWLVIPGGSGMNKKARSSSSELSSLNLLTQPIFN